MTDEATLTALNSGELDAHIIREMEPRNGFAKVLLASACSKSGVGVGLGTGTAATTLEDVIALRAGLAGGDGRLSEKSQASFSASCVL